MIVDPLRSSEYLDDMRLSWWERLSIYALGIIISIVALAILSESMMQGNFLDTVFQEYFLDPIRAESLADGSYNQVNTLSYNVTLILSVISIAVILRRLGIAATECTIIAIIPWVFWAALGEVVEDAGLFDLTLQPWFVSPGIHFQGAIWVVSTGFLASIAANSGNEKDDRLWVTGASISLIMFQTILFLTSLQEGRIGTAMEDYLNLWPVAIFGIFGIIFAVVSHPIIERW